MRIKKILSVVLFIVMLALASCSSVPTQTPNVTVTSEATVTSTPTLTPAPTETPPPTKDPNAPAEFSRFVNGVYYLEKTTQNNTTLTYTWNKERLVYERVVFTGNLLDFSQKDINNAGIHQPDQLLTKVVVDNSLEGEMLLPTLTHKPNMDSGNATNFTSNFWTDIGRALIDGGIIKNMGEFGFNNWNAKMYYLDFTNADGPQRWGLWPGSTIAIHIRGDYDVLKQNMDTNGFSDATSRHNYGPENSYMVKIWTENGNLLVDIAPSLRPANEWTEKQILEMIFFGPADVMESEDLTQPQSGSKLSEYVLNGKSLPYFTFGPPQ